MTEMDPVHVPAAYGLVMERIERAIHLGMYAPGDRLPPERQLSEHLGVARATVREAMQVLRARGYVESRRGTKGGWFVMSPDASLERLRRQVRDSLSALDDILDFRIAVEGAAARLAALRRSDEDLRRIRGTVEDMGRSRDVPQFRRADSAFHLAIAQAASNPMLHDATVDARATMFIMLDAIGFEVLLENSLNAHRRILRGIELADEAEAERAAIEHIETTRRELHDLVRKGEEER